MRSISKKFIPGKEEAGKHGHAKIWMKMGRNNIRGSLQGQFGDI